MQTPCDIAICTVSALNSSMPHQTEVSSIYAATANMIEYNLPVGGVRNEGAFNTCLDNIFELENCNKRQSAVIILIFVHKI